MKQFYVLAILVIFSCKEAAKDVPLEEKVSQGIVYEEYTGIEPTKPEETEVYQPVPPVVKPITGNNSIPSDAIVLFDIGNLN